MLNWPKIQFKHYLAYNQMALIIDTETTDKQTSGDYKLNTARVLQLSMMVCNERLEMVDLKDYIIKQNAPINKYVPHNITEEISRKKGLDFAKIVNELRACLRQTTHILAHNARFDILMLKSELHKIGEFDLINEINTKIVVCTMQETMRIVQSKNKKGHLKQPKLAELYKFATGGAEMENAHDSKFDVIGLHTAIKALYDNGKFTFGSAPIYTEICEEYNFEILKYIFDRGFEEMANLIEKSEMEFANSIKLDIDELIFNMNLLNCKPVQKEDNLPQPNCEQAEIIELVSSGQNVLCDAVAGSGKTTTVLLLAKKDSAKKVMQITYNAELKEEVRRRSANIANLEVHTYHSLAVKFYDSACHTDEPIKGVLARGIPPRRKIPHIDILVIDEAQDMTPLFFRLIRKFLADMPNGPTLLILGDKYQSIYDFKGADARFLTLADQIWGCPFVRKSLATSFRLTNQIAWLVNDVMLKEPYIVAQRDGPHITYIRKKSFAVAQDIMRIVETMMQEGEITPEDIFVLSGSIRSANAPYKRLENLFVARGIPCYVPTSEDKEMDDNIVKGKAVFTTFHQAKGRERKLVIVYGFDSNYFKFYGRNKPREVCPSDLYVAVTRAKSKLVLIDGAEPLSFLKYDQMVQRVEYVQHVGNIGSILGSHDLSEANDNKESHSTTPTELVRFLKEDAVSFCSAAVEQIYSVERGAITNINLDYVISCENGLVEEVADLNGLTIPAMWIDNTNAAAHSTIANTMRRVISNIPLGNYLHQYVKNIPETLSSPQDYLYLANLYRSYIDNLHHKMRQIDNYDWLTQEQVNGCIDNLNSAVNKDVELEHPIDNFCHCKCKSGIGANWCNCAITAKFIREKCNGQFSCIDIAGRIDAIDRKTIWEFKCVRELTLEHKLQLIVYAFLWNYYRKPGAGPREFKLMNIRTGEILKLDAESPLVDEIMYKLFLNKYKKIDEKSDCGFVAHCKSLRRDSVPNDVRDNFQFDMSETVKIMSGLQTSVDTIAEVTSNLHNISESDILEPIYIVDI